MTHAGGNYLVTDITAGTYTLTVSKEGYQSQVANSVVIGNVNLPQAFVGFMPVDTTVVDVAAQENINDESLLLTYSRFHQHYRSTFPGKIRGLGCAAAHMCYVAMGRAEAAVIANESYRGLAAACIIVAAAGGKISKMDGSDFFLNEYLDGARIDEHLLVEQNRRKDVFVLLL